MQIRLTLVRVREVETQGLRLRNLEKELEDGLHLQDKKERLEDRVHHETKKGGVHLKRHNFGQDKAEKNSNRKC